MRNHLGISEQELHAFVDGELDPNRAEEVAKLINSDVVVAARIAAFRSDKYRLAHLFEEVRERPLPEEWVLAIRSRPLRLQPSHLTAYLSKRSIFAIAACLLLMLGLGLVLERFFASSEDAIVAEALAARQQVMRPQQVFSAATLAEAAERNQLMATVLAMTLKAPDLSKMGYRLDDIRVFAGLPGGKAIELSYRDPQNRIFTLYVRHPSSPARVDLIQRDGMRICIWQDDVLGAVMLGEMSAGEMARIASLAYAGLTL
jgi:anti-sigma factor RsiW